MVSRKRVERKCHRCKRKFVTYHEQGYTPPYGKYWCPKCQKKEYECGGCGRMFVFYEDKVFQFGGEYLCCTCLNPSSTETRDELIERMMTRSSNFARAAEGRPREPEQDRVTKKDLERLKERIPCEKHRQWRNELIAVNIDGRE